MHFFFYFQAEDSIRHPLVTGVQTCALPICTAIGNDLDDTFDRESSQGGTQRVPGDVVGDRERFLPECRSRWQFAREDARPDPSCELVDDRMAFERGRAHATAALGKRGSARAAI